MSNKLFLKIFTMTFMAGLFTVILFNYCSDPIQYYRYSKSTPLYGNDRWQVAGFIRNFEYDQIVLGTSMTQNFSLQNIKKAMNSNPIRLSVAGLPIQEQAIILKRALKEGKVKSVIWGVERGYLKYQRGQLQETFPARLYEDNIIGHLHYLSNITTTGIAIKNLSRRICNKTTNTELENYNSWYKDFTFAKEIILKEYTAFMKNVSHKPLQRIRTIEALPHDIKIALKQQVDNFQKDVLQVILENPKVTFYLFLPPYSLAYYKQLYFASSEAFDADALLRKYMIEKCNELPNVVLYEFETDLNIVANLNNYKDLMHYSKEINDHMIHCFGAKKSIITLKNLESNHQAFLSLPEKAFQ